MDGILLQYGDRGWGWWPAGLLDRSGILAASSRQVGPSWRVARGSCVLARLYGSLYRAPDSQLGTALAQHCTLTVIRLPYAPHASTLLSDTVPWPY